VTPRELIRSWRKGKIREGSAVHVRGRFMATSTECWMPIDKEWTGSPARNRSVQLIAETDNLLDGLAPFHFCGGREGGLVMELADVAVDGTACTPSFSGYYVGVRDVTSLVVYDDMEGEGLPSGLGKGLQQGSTTLMVTDTGKFRLQREEAQGDDSTDSDLMSTIPTILDEIVDAKRTEIARAKALTPEAALRERLADAPAPRDFFAALAAGPPIRLIAEVKKASPSKGVIREDFHPVEIAGIYQAHGASCISVLTDGPYFQGSLDYLRQVRAAVDVPVLRKDFILDPYQVLEARAAGADAVLLIAECLDDEALKTLHDAIVALGMTPLVELYEPENLPRVLAIGARLIGINNRDLRTFATDLEHTIRLRRHIPADRAVVGESGIRTRADVERLEAAGVAAVLVGETLMASQDIGAAVDRLLGVGR
jgi:indole-3-glycerol phosphate synthase